MASYFTWGSKIQDLVPPLIHLGNIKNVDFCPICPPPKFRPFAYTPKIPAIKSYWGHYLVPNWQHITVKMGFYMNDIIRKYIWSEILSAIDDVNHSIQTGLNKIVKHITLPGI